MVWGYLSEFWNAITQVGDYTVAFFESIGNAVAGAIGGLFSNLIHHIYDVFYFATWFFESLIDLITTIFTPLTWIFNFLKGFKIGVTSTPITETIDWVVSQDILDVFSDVMPYWNYFLWSIGAGFGILVIFFILKRLNQI